MPRGAWSGLVLLVREGYRIEREFGLAAVESLAEIGELLEQSVVAPSGVVRGAAGLEFELLNPPLRDGAFGGVAVRCNGTAVPPERIRFRPGEGTSWRTVAEVTPSTPLVWRPGEAIQWRLEGVDPPDDRPVQIRLELASVAIPPLVWVEFQGRLRAPPPAGPGGGA
ncbi:MAG: hypothetical protein ACYCPV_02640 [Thermoplasmata archaeon]